MTSRAKWRVIGEGYEQAEVGHLHAYVRGDGGYEEPGHPSYEPERFAWYVAPDDEDKNERRSLASGTAVSMVEAKSAIVTALRGIVSRLQDDVRALECSS